MSSSVPANLAPSFSHFDDEIVKAMEAITGLPAARLIAQSGILNDEREDELSVLDNAAGAGVVTALLMQELPRGRKVKVVLADLEQRMVDLAKQRAEQRGWQNLDVQKADAQELPFADASFDYILWNFGPQLLPHEKKGLAEAHRVLRPHSTLGYTSWTSPGFLPLLIAADPSFRVPPLFSAPHSTVAGAAGFLGELGFEDVKVEPVSVPVKFDGVEHFFQAMKKGVPGLWADEERNKKVAAMLTEKFGEAPFELMWEGLVITAKKA
ncbi:hypothetical protein JCM10213_004577 [Rhodosporidiobolus nylandii]